MALRPARAVLVGQALSPVHARGAGAHGAPWTGGSACPTEDQSRFSTFQRPAPLKPVPPKESTGGVFQAQELGTGSFRVFRAAELGVGGGEGEIDLRAAGFDLAGALQFTDALFGFAE